MNIIVTFSPPLNFEDLSQIHLYSTPALSMSSGDVDRGHSSRGSKSSKSSRKTHRKPLDSSAASSGLSATPHTHSSPPLSYVPYGNGHPAHSSITPFPTNSHTFMHIPSFLLPWRNSTYSSSDTPFWSGSSPRLFSLRFRYRSSKLESRGTYSTLHLTQFYKALGPTLTASPAPVDGEPQLGDTNSFGRVVIVPNGSGFHLEKRVEML